MVGGLKHSPSGEQPGRTWQDQRPHNPEIPLLGNHPGETVIKIPRRIWAEIFTVALLVVKHGRSALGKLEQREEQGVHTATQGVSKQ